MYAITSEAHIGATLNSILAFLYGGGTAPHSAFREHRGALEAIFQKGGVEVFLGVLCVSVFNASLV